MKRLIMPYFQTTPRLGEVDTEFGHIQTTKS